MDSQAADRLLADEYLLLQKRIEEFDTRLLTIKAWSVTFAAGAIVLAFKDGKPSLLLVSAASAALFWMVETIVKSHQRAHYPRMAEIEDHFAGVTATVPMRIYGSWLATYNAPGRLRRHVRHARYGAVCLPHLLIVLVALALWIVTRRS